MTWYAASIIMFVKFKDGIQNKFPIWENVILIEASSSDEAFRKAEKRALDGEGDSDGTFRWEDRDAEWVFAGIRKLLECIDVENKPADGNEITFSHFEVESKEVLSQLVNGETVMIKYEE